MAKYKNHPYADLFPMMSAAELDALAADIAENGLRQPVVLYQGAVLDGRNRVLACEKAGVEPTFTEHEGDDTSALALVISLNVQRRDLTAAQRAIVAARALGQMPERRGRPGKDGKSSHVLSRDLVALQFKVSDKSVQQSKAILAEAPDLAEQVLACALHLSAAYEQLQERRKEARQKEKDAQRIAEYKDAVSSGDMTWEEAMEEALKQEREEKERIAEESQARQLWLSKLLEFVRWIEDSVATRSDEHLTWYAQEEFPDLAADRIAAVQVQLERISTLTCGGINVGTATDARQSKTRDAKARPPAA